MQLYFLQKIFPHSSPSSPPPPHPPPPPTGGGGGGGGGEKQEGPSVLQPTTEIDIREIADKILF